MNFATINLGTCKTIPYRVYSKIDTSEFFVNYDTSESAAKGRFMVSYGDVIILEPQCLQDFLIEITT